MMALPPPFRSIYQQPHYYRQAEEAEREHIAPMPSLRNTRSNGKPKEEHEELEEHEEEDGRETAHEQLDDEEEEEAETRCICGQMDPPDADGLYIQCEKCSVWQHGFCVSISDNVPDKYWCEQCKPELHTIVIRPQGNISRYLPVQPKEPAHVNKRRARRGAHDDEHEDALQKRKRERATMNSREDARYEAMIQRALEESKKEAHLEEPGDESSCTLSSRRPTGRGAHHEDDDSEMLDDDATRHSDTEAEHEDHSKPLSSESAGRVRKLKKESASADNSESNESMNSTINQKKKTKRNKRSTGKDQPSSRISQKDKDSTIDFNKPTKPRIPQQRMTVNEMRKRVAAILEFIGRTQVDIATEQKDQNELTKFVEDETMKLTVQKLFDNYNGSLELMDGLTRKLLLWEQQYGKFGDKI